MEFEEMPSHAETMANEKDLTGYAEDAEEAVMNMIQDHVVENLNDPHIWKLMEGFMDRIVRLLGHLEDLHEETRPKQLNDIEEEGEEEDEEGDHNGDSGDMLDELRDKLHVNGEDDYHHNSEEYDDNGYDESNDCHNYDQQGGHGQHEYDHGGYDEQY